MFSKQLNPWMWHTAWLAKLVEDQRIDKANTTPEGTLYEAEQTASQQIAKALHDMSDARDKAMHGLFSQLYGGTR